MLIENVSGNTVRSLKHHIKRRFIQISKKHFQKILISSEFRNRDIQLHCLEFNMKASMESLKGMSE